MFVRLVSTALLAGTLLIPTAAPAPVFAAAPVPCANIAKAACTLKGTYRFTADGAAYALAGKLTVKQTAKKLQVAGLLRFVQEGGIAPAPGTTVSFSVAYMTNRVGCAAGEGGVTHLLLAASNVAVLLADTPLDSDLAIDEYAAKVTPRKTSMTLATIAADLQSAGAKTGEIVLLLDGGRACAVLATRR
jgi:hypothetical protein